MTKDRSREELTLEQQEEQLRARARQLPGEQRALYHRRMNAAYKDPDTYAALNWALLAGIHHYYLGNWIRGTFNLLVSIVGLLGVLAGSLIGFLLLVVVFLIELPALFRAQRICRRHNNRQAERILQAIENDASGSPPART